jgi:hypothetical protein
MTAVRNEFTCDIMKSKPGDRSDMQRFEDGWERIFGKRMADADSPRLAAEQVNLLDSAPIGEGDES